MRHLVFFLLTLGLFAAQSPTGTSMLQAFSSEPADSGESPDRGWEIDPNG